MEQTTKVILNEQFKDIIKSFDSNWIERLNEMRVQRINTSRLTPIIDEIKKLRYLQNVPVETIRSMKLALITKFAHIVKNMISGTIISREDANILFKTFDTGEFHPIAHESLTKYSDKFNSNIEWAIICRIILLATDYSNTKWNKSLSILNAISILLDRYNKDGSESTNLNEEEKFYAGAPAFFKCFRVAAIGSNTGTQIYGWGLYFGNEKQIASSYSGSGKQKLLLFQGKNPSELAFEYDCIIFERLPSKLSTVEEFTEYANDMIEILSEDDPSEETDYLISEYKRFIKIIENLEVTSEPMKYVYEVLLHKGKSPNQYEYLGWDISVPQSQIDKINAQAKKESISLSINNLSNGSQVYHSIEKHFEKNKSKNAPKDASLFLLRAGIDGNTHSRGTVRIIFDERAITIVNVCKNG